MQIYSDKKVEIKIHNAMNNGIRCLNCLHFDMKMGLIDLANAVVIYFYQI